MQRLLESTIRVQQSRTLNVDPSVNMLLSTIRAHAASAQRGFGSEQRVIQRIRSTRVYQCLSLEKVVE